jgi:hypothetical protein
MALSMNQVFAMQARQPSQGLGYVDAIAAIVGPLVGGAADIYKTSADSKQNRKELKQRQREFQALIPVYERQQKQQALTTIASVRQQQIVSGYQATFAPYFVQVVALGALALVAISIAKGGKKK